MKKKLGPDLSLYAYNSEFINKPKINKNGGFNFASLTKGFYDDIISAQKSIRTCQSNLNNVKTTSLKESVYSNRKIPSNWKTKLNYRKDVCKTIQGDNDFAIYLGKKEEIDPMESKLNHFLGKDDLNEKNQTGIDLLPKINRKLKTISPNVRRGTLRHTQNFSSYLNNQNKDPNYLSEKEIASKLDEYKSKYDMNEYMDTLRSQKIEETKNKFLITEIDEEHKQEAFSPYHTVRVPIEGSSNKKNQINKPKVFKSSIYINLLPKETEQETNQKDRRSRTKTFTNFLNVDIDEPIVITNPKKRRELEIINYYGPRYNFCSICQRKNLEFYQNFETKQCFKLLNYLKNERLPKRNIPTSQPATSRNNEETN